MTNLIGDKNNSWKRASVPDPIIRREFVDLTGDHCSAVVLNQLLYWTQRVKDFDLFLEEERSFKPECNISPRQGWIYKTAQELSEETMLKVSLPSIQKYLKLLLEQGWVEERVNSADKWKDTTQYRVNLRKLQKGLHTIGHTLPEVYRGIFSSSLGEKIHPHGFSKALSLNEENSNENFLPSNENFREISLESSCTSEEFWDSRNFQSNENTPETPLHAAPKNCELDTNTFSSSEKSLPSDAYTENRNKEPTQRTKEREHFDQFFEIWKKHVCQESLQLTEIRKRQLCSLLSLHFQNDVQQWERFCERIKASSFLMEGGRRWHVSLDWILSEGNVFKVLAGNFDNPERLQLKKTEGIKSDRDQERAETLASIQDPIWQDWCTQLSCWNQQKSPVSLVVLKEIANANFREFDGRLVWIESEDLKVLSRINDLRLPLLTIAQRSFPQARNIRTQLRKDIPLSFSSALKNDSNPIITTQGEPYVE